MASRTRKHSRSHKRTQKRGRGRTSRRSVAQRGGYPASAWGWQLNNLGDGWTQFMNTMKVQPGASGPDSQSNVIVPNKGLSLPPAPADAAAPAPAQKGGRRRYRAKRGGNWNTVLNQAAVPAALWAMQYRTKRRRKH
jgi:hypothetical protein